MVRSPTKKEDWQEKIQLYVFLALSLLYFEAFSYEL